MESLIDGSKQSLLINEYGFHRYMKVALLLPDHPILELEEILDKWKESSLRAKEHPSLFKNVYIEAFGNYFGTS